MKNKIQFDKNFWWKKYYVFLFNLRHVIHVRFFHIVNLLCYGGQFSNITFINVKTKYRMYYLLHVS